MLNTPPQTTGQVAGLLGNLVFARLTPEQLTERIEQAAQPCRAEFNALLYKTGTNVDLAVAQFNALCEQRGDLAQNVAEIMRLTIQQIVADDEQHPMLFHPPTLNDVVKAKTIAAIIGAKTT